MNKKKLFHALSLMVFFSEAPLAHQKAYAAYPKREYQPLELKEFLFEFYDNPKEMMAKLPPKTGPISKRTFSVELKSEYRKKFCRIKNGSSLCLNNPYHKARIEADDSPKTLVDNPQTIITSLLALEEQKLLSKRLTKQPWSDDYWPVYAGLTAKRYGDPENKDTQNWNDAHQHFLSRPISSFIERKKTELLSPAEKYDLLVGDQSLTLTNKMWEEGRPHYEASGHVPLWAGICHGWAPASYMFDRPSKKISIMAADGKTVLQFFPSDIKALASLTWANAKVGQQFAGGRCDVKSPKKDENGRIIEQACFDSNPATWHIGVINQIGQAQRPLILDATYDFEVWNQPVIGHDVTYFHPETGVKSKSYKTVTINMQDFLKDKFKKYRNSGATQIVGVEMAVEYVVETLPSHAPINAPGDDVINRVIYRYDLELDAAGNPIGGEWYSNAHPDFLWTPPHGQRPASPQDLYAREEWPVEKENGVFKSFPQNWSKLAAGSSKTGTPLARIIEGLIERSNSSL